MVYQPNNNPTYNRNPLSGGKISGTHINKNTFAPKKVMQVLLSTRPNILQPLRNVFPTARCKIPSYFPLPEKITQAVTQTQQRTLHARVH